MRFLPFENKEIQEAIREAGLDPAHFRSVKRQGKLNLIYRDHLDPFRFFRKKETRLNPAGKWEDQTSYILYPGGKATEVGEWPEVMKAFREWLKSIIPSDSGPNS